MERLATTKKTWWTRKVGDYTMLCFYTYLRTPLTHTPILHETFIGKPHKKPWIRSIQEFHEPH